MESASPDLKNLLLQNLIISPSILLLYSTVLLNKRSAICCLVAELIEHSHFFCLQLEKKDNCPVGELNPGPLHGMRDC